MLIPPTRCAHELPGRPQLTTELTISSDEFEEYDIESTPMTIAFHLREFNVRILVLSRFYHLNRR